MPKQLKQVPYEVGLPECIIIDIDGTLALHQTRSPFEYNKSYDDAINVPVWELIRMIQKARRNVVTIVVTGRSNHVFKEPVNGVYNNVQDITLGWLYKHNIHVDEYYMNQPPENEPDQVFKKKIYEEFIKGRYNVLYVLEDRKRVIDMYREIGLTVLDVAGWDG